MTHFRDPLIAASLKHRYRRSAGRRTSHFRDPLIAASLKLFVVLVRSLGIRTQFQDFRDPLIAASLKQAGGSLLGPPCA